MWADNFNLSPKVSRRRCLEIEALYACSRVYRKIAQPDLRDVRPSNFDGGMLDFQHRIRGKLVDSPDDCADGRAVGIERIRCCFAFFFRGTGRGEIDLDHGPRYVDRGDFGAPAK